MYQVPWFILAVAAVDCQKPFLQPVFNTISIGLYSLAYGLWWVQSHQEEWQGNLQATNSLHKLPLFQILEFTQAALVAITSTYLIFETLLPILVFWICFALSLIGGLTLRYMWRKQLRSLTIIS